MLEEKKAFNDPKMQETYDTLFKRAILGNKEALASLKVLLQNTKVTKKYSIFEDIRSLEVINEAPPSLKTSISDFIKSLRGI